MDKVCCSNQVLPNFFLSPAALYSFQASTSMGGNKGIIQMCWGTGICGIPHLRPKASAKHWKFKPPSRLQPYYPQLEPWLWLPPTHPPNPTHPPTQPTHPPNLTYLRIRGSNTQVLRPAHDLRRGVDAVLLRLPATDVFVFGSFESQNGTSNESPKKDGQWAPCQL